LAQIEGKKDFENTPVAYYYMRWHTDIIDYHYYIER